MVRAKRCTWCLLQADPCVTIQIIHGLNIPAKSEPECQSKKWSCTAACSKRMCPSCSLGVFFQKPYLGAASQEFVQSDSGGSVGPWRAKHHSNRSQSYKNHGSSRATGGGQARYGCTRQALDPMLRLRAPALIAKAYITRNLFARSSSREARISWNPFL